LRASVETAKQWRTDKFLRHLEVCEFRFGPELAQTLSQAWMIAVDKDMSLTLTGNGDVISEPTDGVIGAQFQFEFRVVLMFDGCCQESGLAVSSRSQRLAR
jgi:hypothetical protein